MTIPTSNSANFMLLYNEKSPRAAPSACCPPRGSFCLGAARRQKSPHAAPSARCPQRESFHLGTARRQKKIESATLPSLSKFAAPGERRLKTAAKCPHQGSAWARLCVADQSMA